MDHSSNLYIHQMSTPTPSPTTVSWTNNTVYCNTYANECFLWGVAWQWLVVSFTIFFIGLSSYFFVVTLFAVIKYILSSYNYVHWYSTINANLFQETNWLFRVGMFWLAYTFLQFPTSVTNILDHFASIPFIICLFFWANGFFNSVTLIVHAELAKRRINNQDTMISAYEEFIRVIKYITFIIIALIALVLQDVDVLSFFSQTSLFALALVFGTQPWVRNLVGGVVIFFDDKFSVGDTIRVMEIEGVVEAITLRSTYVRREDNSVVLIPNSRVLEQPVSNFSKRAKRLLEIRVHVAHDTDISALRQALADIEALLQTLHPNLTAHVLNPVDDFNTTDQNVGSGATNNNGNGNINNPPTISSLAQSRKRFFVVMDTMYEILVWTYVDDIKDKSHALIRTEVLLAIKDVLEQRNIQPYSRSQLLGSLSDNDSDGDDYGDGRDQIPADIKDEKLRRRKNRAIKQRTSTKAKDGFLPKRVGKPNMNETYHDEDVDLLMASLAFNNNGV